MWENNKVRKLTAEYYQCRHRMEKSAGNEVMSKLYLASKPVTSL